MHILNGCFIFTCLLTCLVDSEIWMEKLKALATKTSEQGHNICRGFVYEEVDLLFCSSYELRSYGSHSFVIVA